MDYHARQCWYEVALSTAPESWSIPRTHKSADELCYLQHSYKEKCLTHRVTVNVVTCAFNCRCNHCSDNKHASCYLYYNHLYTVSVIMIMSTMTLHEKTMYSLSRQLYVTMSASLQLKNVLWSSLQPFHQFGIVNVCEERFFPMLEGLMNAILFLMFHKHFSRQKFSGNHRPVSLPLCWRMFSWLTGNARSTIRRDQCTLECSETPGHPLNSCRIDVGPNTPDWPLYNAAKSIIMYYNYTVL